MIKESIFGNTLSVWNYFTNETLDFGNFASQYFISIPL